LELSGPVKASNGIALPLPFFIILMLYSCVHFFCPTLCVSFFNGFHPHILAQSSHAKSREWLKNHRFLSYYRLTDDIPMYGFVPDIDVASSPSSNTVAMLKSVMCAWPRKHTNYEVICQTACLRLIGEIVSWSGHHSSGAPHHGTQCTLFNKIFICIITNSIDCLSLVYWIITPLQVSGVSAAHHQEVECIYVANGTC
jgi:hypothetical protein